MPTIVRGSPARRQRRSCSEGQKSSLSIVVVARNLLKEVITPPIIASSFQGPCVGRFGQRLRASPRPWPLCPVERGLVLGVEPEEKNVDGLAELVERPLPSAGKAPPPRRLYRCSVVRGTGVAWGPGCARATHGSGSIIAPEYLNPITSGQICGEREPPRRPRAV
jgi:hypothetical protein